MRWVRLSGSFWLAVRRPLALALFLGCAVSLMASGTLTLRLALPAALYWTFIPLAEIAGLAVVLRKRLRADLVDAFFAGHRPWLIWLAAFAAWWTFVPPPLAYQWGAFSRIWELTAVMAVGSSLWLDLAFFQRAGAGSRKHAARDVAVHRLVSWPLVLVIFVAPAAWQEVASRFGL